VCGIFGVSGDYPRERDVAEIIGSLACRGPDQQATVRSERTCVVCTRLALWHEGSCEQPYTDRNYTVAFNGELFNLSELRDELGFPGASEVQTIMVGWQRYGADFFRLIDGQFAAVMVNHRTGVLKAVRDEWGICPLYYSTSGRTIAVGSSVESIQVLRGVRDHDIDVAGVLEVAAWWGFGQEATCWRGIAQLQPGHELLFDPASGLRVAQYGITSGPHPGSRHDAQGPATIEQLGIALEEAVRRRTRDTSHVATLLSGGVDSALVARAAVAEGVTQSFGLTLPNERLVSEQQTLLAAHLGLSHVTVEATASALVDAFPVAVRRIGAPVSRLGPVGMYLLAEKVRTAGLRACLSGEGADEIFCGYDSFRLAYVTADLSLETLRTLGSPEIPVEAGELYWKFASSGPWNPLRKRLNNARFLAYFLTGDVQTEIARMERIAEDWERIGDPAEAVRNIEITHTLAGYLLGPQGDHVWASQAVEMRYPFLAKAVAALGLSSPAHELFSLTEGKTLIRNLARQWFSETWLGEAAVDFTKRAYRIDINLILSDPRARVRLQEFIEGCPSSLFDVGRVRKLFAACVDRDHATDRESAVLVLAASLGVLLQRDG
jgi:asparagine synthase (glutamine-hydrolysing)